VCAKLQRLNHAVRTGTYSRVDEDRQTGRWCSRPFRESTWSRVRCRSLAYAEVVVVAARDLPAMKRTTQRTDSYVVITPEPGSRARLQGNRRYSRVRSRRVLSRLSRACCAVAPVLSPAIHSRLGHHRHHAGPISGQGQQELVEPPNGDGVGHHVPAMEPSIRGEARLDCSRWHR
jgi:hypothetical protein